MNRRAALQLMAMGAGSAWAAGASAAPEGTMAPANAVLVELFTSQGCSSCPPADALLVELAMRPGVVALSYNVDYWDYIGWKDTLADPLFTKRQVAYVRSLGIPNPYTPQMIIDGAIDVPGSRKADVLSKLAGPLAAKKNPPQVNLTYALKGDRAVISAGAGRPDKEAMFLVARVRKQQTVSITAGENRGRSVTYANVVRSIAPLGKWKGEPAEISLPRRDPAIDADMIAAWLQAGETGPVLGACIFAA